VIAAGLVVLLLATTAFAGHQVTHHDGKLEPCAVCAVVAHTPMTTAYVPALGAPTLVVGAVAPSIVTAPVVRVRPIALGRAPPSSSAPVPST
jgi:hypothetical protein